MFHDSQRTTGLGRLAPDIGMTQKERRTAKRKEAEEKRRRKEVQESEERFASCGANMYLHAYEVHVVIFAHLRVCVRVFMCMCVRVCTHVGACACLCVCLCDKRVCV